MTRTTHKLSLISLALAATMQLAACGGGDAGAPDIFAPTVEITAQDPANQSDPVTFTFTFNEDVGSSFSTSDITVTGGTAGTLTRVSGTVYTLPITPNVSGGQMSVSVNARTFSDAAGNVNTVNPTATYDAFAPMVTITDNVSATTATGPITFTFTFTKAVSGFTADDVTVARGTKGALVMASDSKSATLVITPTGTTGTVAVNVAAGTFTDSTGKTNTLAASATQDFDTTGPAAPAAFVSFDESPAKFTGMGAWDGALPDVVAAPGGVSGNVLKITKPTGSQVWSGAYFTVPQIPFTSTQKAITAKVYSTVANAVIKLKVENTPSNFVEVEGTPVAQANTWTTVTWNMSAVDTAQSYTVFAITPDATRPTDGASYYIDDINVATTPVAPPTTGLPITFDSSSVTYSFTTFEGAYDGGVVADPAGGTNMVGKVVRNPGGPWYGGVTVSTGANNSVSTIPFTSTSKTMTMRVYSPSVGMRVRMKVENASNPGITAETDAVTTATGWQTLSFNFNNPGLAPPVTGGPTAALDAAQTYNKVTLFFNISAAADAWAGTYYFDDIAFPAP